ncbi:MAG: ATPase [Acidobacteriota bacterium]
MKTRVMLLMAGSVPWVLGLSLSALRADVTDSSATGFSIKKTLTIKASRAAVYEALTAAIGSWWDSGHTYSGSSRNLFLETKANGCFCERLKGGGSVRHLTVVYVDPGKALRLSGGLGPLQVMAVTGSMSWVLSEAGPDTKLEFVYVVGGYTPEGLTGMAAAVDRVLSGQLDRLKNYAETGSPEGP